MVASQENDGAKRLMQELAPYLSSHRSQTHRLCPERSALIVIDMQRYFLDKSSHAYLPDSAKILGNVRKLVNAYRARSLPIIYTRHAVAEGEDTGAMGRWWKDVLREGDEMAEILSELMPADSDLVLRKNRYSAFVGTDLEKRLRGLSVTDLVITGVMTHLCCESTARDAFMKDFDVFVVIDGTASETEDLHVSSLKTLTAGFAIPVLAKEVVAWVEKSK
jgi:isochorismate hydrolase